MCEKGPICSGFLAVCRPLSDEADFSRIKPSLGPAPPPRAAGQRATSARRRGGPSWLSRLYVHHDIGHLGKPGTYFGLYLLSDRVA